MNWRKMFVYLVAALLLFGLLPVLSFAQGGAGQTAAVARIEADLLEQLAAGGTSDMIVVMAEQADLSPAYSMGWKERGEFVYNTLKATAERSQANAQALLRANGLKYQTFIAGNELYVWAGNLQVATALAALPEVAFIRAPQVYQIDPPLTAGQPEATFDWGILDAKADQFWAVYGLKGEGIVVANIDTGVDYTHAALQPNYKCLANPSDPSCWLDPGTQNCTGPNGGPCDTPYMGIYHGTHTMGTMAARDDPALQYTVGMAPNAQWIACLGCPNGSCPNFDLNTCADWILAPGGNPANRPHVVNNSWGGPGCNTWYQAKVQAWRAAGIFPAFSAGNNYNCNSLGSPGDYQESFGSASHRSDRQISDFSSRGPSCFGHDPYTKPNISAPGEGIISTAPGNGWVSMSGTSMASPHSAGAVALLWSCNPSLIGQIDQTFEILQDNADTPPAGNCGAPPDGEGNYTFGYGYLNIYQAGLLWCGEIGHLHGHVYDAATNAPIAGAVVNAGGPTATTDPQGYYTMTLAVGTYDVTAGHPLYTSLTIPGVVIVTDTTTTQDFSLQPRGRLWGYVTDYDNGFPLEGATVTADDGTSDDTDATGYYEMYLDEGTYVVTATMQDYAPDTATVAIVSGQDTRQDFSLKAAVVFIPSPLHVTVPWQSTYQMAATLLNRLPWGYDFELREIPGGFVPTLLGEVKANALRADADVAPQSRWPVAPLAVGDPLFSVNVEAATGDNQCLGIEWADGFWWVTGGNVGSDPNKLYKINTAGNLVATYDQPASCTGWGGRDLAYDGTYLYTGCDDGQVHQFDPVAGAWTGSFPGPIAPPRALAYDPATDHFWTASWDSNIIEFDRSGTVVHQWTNTYIGKYGMAWDQWSSTGPYLWIWTQDPGVVAAQYYFDGTNLTPTGLTWQGQNPSGDIAGGATTVPDYPDYPGQLLFAGLHQSTPDTVWVYDLDVAVTPPNVPWFGQDPVSGTVPASNTLDVTALFTATYDTGIDQPGDYYCDLRVQGDPLVTVRVTMTVLPPADMGKVAGTVTDNCTGDPVEATVNIAGGDPITQTMSNPDTGYYAAWLFAGTYTFTFSAAGYQTYMTVVDVTESGEVVLDVNLVPDRPCLAVEPDRFEFWVLTGTQESDLLSLINNGAQDLDFTIFEISGTAGFLDIGPAQAGQVTQVAESKGMADEQGGGLLPDDTGGPDPFGYTYKDSDEPGGPTFDWIEISGTGQNLGLTDDSHIFPLDLPFPFNFYGVDYNQIAVGSNGSVYFVNQYLGLGNVCLPGDGGYGVWDFIVGMWDDLNPGAGGAVYYEALNYKGQDVAVVEWYQVPHYGTSDDMTYEIILFPNGSILIQYLDPSNEAGIGATVGIQGYWENPSYYLEYSCNAAVLDYNLAICFAYPGSPGCTFGEDVPWVWEEPVTGTVPALSTGEVGVTVTSYLTEPLPLGTYTATLLVASNDPVKGSENVPVIMHIIEELATPLLSADTYECGLPGSTVTHTFILTNTGPTAGSFDIAVEYASWPATPSVSTIGPLDVGESATFQVYVDIPPLEAVLGSDLFTVTATYQNPPYPGDVAYGETCAQVTPGVSIGPDSTGYGLAGETVFYTLTVTNLGDYTDHFLLDVGGAAWTTTLSITDTGNLTPGATVDVLVAVEIPAGAAVGSSDTATLSATSATDPAISATAQVTTGVLSPYYYYYLPIISKNW